MSVHQRAMFDAVLLRCRFGFKTCPANSDCYCAFNLNLVVLEFCVSWDCAPSADPEL